MSLIKFCGESILKPLELIFKSCFGNGKFLSDWKKANIVPVHKQGDKQVLKNYHRPILLLPIYSKIPARLIFNEIFVFYTDNDLISPNQSRFNPGDSCINHFLSITHDIYKSFDDE